MLLDIIFLVSIVYGIFQGFMTGFFTSIIKIIRYCFALVLAMKSSYIMMDYLGSNTNVDTAYIPLFAFILMYILVLGLLSAVSNILSDFKVGLGEQNQSLLNKGIGVLTWSFILSFLFSAFVAFGEQAGLISPNMLASSAVYPYIVDIYPVIKCKLAYLIPAFGNILDSFQNLFADLARQLKGDCC